MSVWELCLHTQCGNNSAYHYQAYRWAHFSWDDKILTQVTERLNSVFIPSLLSPMSSLSNFIISSSYFQSQFIQFCHLKSAPEPLTTTFKCSKQIPCHQRSWDKTWHYWLANVHKWQLRQLQKTKTKKLAYIFEKWFIKTLFARQIMTNVIIFAFHLSMCLKPYKISMYPRLTKLK